ncbi:sensor histidine kinase [Salinimonas lutimaris]|uniref:sensor histidine kinase n=1 Tax=Salinimonas lutimaris TaxID=914153 RepID=UPI0010C03F48|nr:HAMP domain-containing sensor histidine kinase [Salinimonas lutimaris]
MRVNNPVISSCLIGAALVVVAGFISFKLLKQERLVSFEGPVREFVDVKNEQYENLGYELLTVESFFLATDNVTFDEFELFVAPIFEQNIIVSAIFYYDQAAAMGDLTSPTYWQSFDGEMPTSEETMQEFLADFDIKHLSTSDPTTTAPMQGGTRRYVGIVYKMADDEGVLIFYIDFDRAIRAVINNDISKEFFIFDEDEKLIFQNVPNTDIASNAFVEDLFFFDQFWQIKINYLPDSQSYFYYLIPIFALVLSGFIFYLFRYSARLKVLYSQKEDAMTKLQFAQEKIIESEKINAMGGLVAGISHEVNTPLGISITSASHQRDLLDELKQDFDNGVLDSDKFEDFMESSYDMVDMTLKNMQRASKLVASFKRVAVINADDATDIERVDLTNLINEFISNYRDHSDGHTINFIARLPDKAKVSTYPAVITQVLSHLTSNTLLHGFKPEQKQVEVQIALREYKDGFALRFSDNGTGVPPDDLRKIFEPFFTTKRGSGNAGLGLCVVYNLIKSKLKGDLNHGSNPDQGLWISFTVSNLNSKE